MASSNETVSMALFCDFENVALGVRDAKYDKFDIKLVLERLLLKGSIVVKKAYCDWDRYKSFKGAMHEANFELIEIPHVRQSGKNSADIRLVVDALDLCYTKSHVNTFVIISGDSDFSPLVSKLRENAKQVIGVGVQQSTSDLLIANCDEFFFYDDLVRESQRTVAKRESSRQQKSAQPTARPAQDEEKSRNKEDLEKRRTKAVEIAVQTFDALASERGDSGKIWASVLKNAIKRRKPDFNETYYGFRAFGNLLEEAHARGLLEFGRDEKSGAYVYRSTVSGIAGEGTGEGVGERVGEGTSGERTSEVAAESAGESLSEPTAERAAAHAPEPVDATELPEPLDDANTAEAAQADAVTKHESRRRGRGDRKRGPNPQASRQVSHGTQQQNAPKNGQQTGRESAPENARDDQHNNQRHNQRENQRENQPENERESAPPHANIVHTEEEDSTTNASRQQDSAAHAATRASQRAPSELGQMPAAEPDRAPNEADAASSAAAEDTDETQPKRRKQREPRQAAAKKTRKTTARLPAEPAETASPATESSTTVEAAPAPSKKAARKTASTRNRRPRKTAEGNDAE